MDRYLALVHPGRQGYGISFPDFPGCISGGDTLDDALANGAQALRFHAAGMRSDGELIPPPRSFEEIRADPELAEEIAGAILATVPLLPSRGRSIRVQVNIDEQLLAAIDAEAERRGLSRSAFLAEVAALALTDL